MSNITQKHDKLARMLLTDLDVAKEFLEIHLPPEIKFRCDFSSLVIENSSFVHEDLKATYADVVYKVNLCFKASESNSKIAYIYTLIEHQSSPDWLMPLRVLRYQINIIQNHLKTCNEDNPQLPIVVPIVFYNGRASPYPYPNNIADIFVDNDLYHTAELGKFTLIDLTVLEDDEILQHKKVAALESTLKHIQTRDFIAKIETIIKALEVSHKSGLRDESLSATFRYLIDAKEKDEVVLFFDKIMSSELYKYEGDIMTYADYLRQEGEQIGRQQGWQEGRQEGVQQGEHNAQQKIAMEFLRDGDSIERVARCTHLSIDEVQDLLQNIKNK